MAAAKGSWGHTVLGGLLQIHFASSEFYGVNFNEWTEKDSIKLLAGTLNFQWLFGNICQILGATFHRNVLVADSSRIWQELDIRLRVFISHLLLGSALTARHSKYQKKKKKKERPHIQLPHTLGKSTWLHLSSFSWHMLSEPQGAIGLYEGCSKKQTPVSLCGCDGCFAIPAQIQVIIKLEESLGSVFRCKRQAQFFKFKQRWEMDEREVLCNFSDLVFPCEISQRLCPDL